jgi:tripartite-type tricarboxylate transporter receptor subunit TctC
MGVKNAAPDGRTLLVYPGTQLAALPALQHVPYDPVTDFEPIATLFDLLNFVAVPPDRPANTIPQIFRLACALQQRHPFPRQRITDHNGAVPWLVSDDG